MRVERIMTQEPIVVAPGDPLRRAIDLMRRGAFRRLPVLEKGKLVGIVSDRDIRLVTNSPVILREKWYDDYLLETTAVEACMTPDPITISPDTEIVDAARLMREQKVGGLPVMHGEVLVGIVTESDILDYCIEVLESAGLRASGDAGRYRSEVRLRPGLVRRDRVREGDNGMLVLERMSAPAVTITGNISFQDAMKLMQDHRFRRLPVVDDGGQLIGIVSERDLLYASPSPVTSLSVWEIHYLLSKLSVRDIMTREVISTTPDTPLEEAAFLMAEHKIGGLPVVDAGRRVVGVITETDIFKAFVEMLAGGRAGLRLALDVPERKSIFLDLSKTIFHMGGSIVSINSFNGGRSGRRRLVVKVRDVDKRQLVSTLESVGDYVLDARDLH